MRKQRPIPGESVGNGEQLDFPWLIAHRGAMTEAPENGQAAFDLAFYRGADGIEFDVQLTADHVPVIFHDDSLERIAGIKKRVSGCTLESLRKLDLGKWFSDRYAGSRIMTLAQVLQRYAHQGLLMIELKTGAAPLADRNGRSLLAAGVMEQIDLHVPACFRRNLYILSFDAGMLKDAHELAPDLPCILNIHGPWPFSGKSSRKMQQLIRGYCLPFDRLTRKFVDQCHAAGHIVAVYSCNRPADADSARNMGVDVIMTDAPAEVIKEAP
jgi:glycerophosphoryl diester phosphodiesterase